MVSRTPIAREVVEQLVLDVEHLVNDHDCNRVSGIAPRCWPPSDVQRTITLAAVTKARDWLRETSNGQ